MELNERYKESLRQIQEHNYEAARDILRGLYQQTQSEKIAYSLGLVEVKLGMLHVGENYLKSVTTTTIPNVTELIEYIHQQNHRYKIAIEQYNAALDLIEEKKLEDALEKVKELLLVPIPLPIAIYKCYILLILRLNKEEAALCFQNLPKYIQKSNEMSFIYSTFINVKLIPYKEKGLKKITPYMMLFIVGGALSYLLINGQQQEENVQTLLKEEQEVFQEQTIKELEDKDTEEKPSEDVPYTETILKSYYTEGYRAYKESEYESAISYLSHVNKGEITYFSDDAMYYEIQSYIQLEKYEDAIQLIETFLNHTESQFKESSYFYAVHLAQGEALIKLNKIDQANNILTNILLTDAQEWIKQRAKSLLVSM